MRLQSRCLLHWLRDVILRGKSKNKSKSSRVENWETPEQDDNIAGSWISFFLQTHWMYSYMRSNSLWEKSRDKLSDSYTSGERENTHIKTGRKGGDILVPWTPSVAQCQCHTIWREPLTPSFSLKSWYGAWPCGSPGHKSPSVSPISLITGNRLHSASMNPPDFQGQVQTVAN